MIRRRGIELAVSTLILLALGVVILIGFIYVLTGGFARFKSGTDPFGHATDVAAVREACNLACSSEDFATFCCHNYTLDSEAIRCSDTRLSITCSASVCDRVRCA